MNKSEIKLTPMMKQYLEIKEKYKDSVLLFRLGDFYEAFFDDALTVSKVLSIVLTKRQDAPMAGIPYHALDNYLKKLVDSGYKVAICEQMEDPALAKGIVKREVTRVITPGTLIEDELLSTDNSFLLSLYTSKKDSEKLVNLKGVLVDISTGKVLVKNFETFDTLFDFVSSHNVSQIICPEWIYLKVKELFPNVFIDRLDEWYYESSEEKIKNVYGVKSLEHLELGESVYPFGAIIKYIEYTLNTEAKLQLPQFLDESEYISLDTSTIENLSLIPGERGKNLFDVLNKTVTSMGARLLKWVILHPLKNQEKIEERLNFVEAFHQDTLLCNEVREYLNGIYDLERIINRLQYRKANPKDIISLRNTLSSLEPIKEALETNNILKELSGSLPDLSQLYQIISETIQDEFEGELGEGKIIKAGVSKELDDYKELLEHSNEKLKEFEEKERRKTGILKLKVGYNQVFGYYIEVPKGQIGNVPSEYNRLQTLVNAERFTTPELKTFEEKILSASEKVAALEKTLFEDLCEKIRVFSDELRKTAEILSLIDLYSAFGYVSKLYNYVRPQFDNKKVEIIGGRHPIVERFVSDFVPNDILMDEKNRMFILTGPNMSGKSTYIRQYGLISLMAQIGCFVPSDKTILPVFDRIFTRMGARDDISTGKSTFLTEMIEVALIINKATENSLVLLDEVGRGTSTFDGISIAWAITEFIYNEIKCKTIFATHYTELTELKDIYEGVRNYTVEVKETNEGIVFLHKVVEGVADRSYGIEVAHIAGLPEGIIERAREILDVIVEKSDIEKKVGILKEGQIKQLRTKKKSKEIEGQIKFF